MGDLANLESLVRPYVKDCPAILIETALTKAARKFCRRTLLWTVEKPELEIAADANRVRIPTTEGQNIIKVMSAKITGERDNLIPAGSLASLPSSTRPKASHYASNNTQFIHFGPVPDTAWTMDVEVAVMPAVGATEVPDDFEFLWGEAIASGAIAELMMEEGYNWYNPNAAAKHYADFDSGITDAINQRQMGHNTSQQVATSPGFI